MFGEIGLRPEGKPTYRRMDAVRADDQVEAPWCCSLEDHLNARRIGVHRGDHLVEEKLCVLATRLDQDPTEVRTRHLNLAIFRLPRAHAGHSSAGIVDEDQLPYLGCRLVQTVQNAEPPCEVVCTSPNVHRIAARPYALVPLDNGDLVSGPAEQRGKRGTGD